MKVHEPRSECGSGGCITCPFSCSDEAEQVQNYGCLPDAHDIIQMKKESGQNWSCHSDATVLCGGFAMRVKESHPELDIRVGGLISYEIWYHKGQDVAIEEARQSVWG
jgi:hypothetical protein